MTMFNEGTDTAMIASLRAELEATRDGIRKRDAAIDALTARVAEVVAMISDHADDIAGLQTPGRTPDQHLTAVQEAHFALRQRIGVLERSIATMPPGWSADLDAMERTPTPAVEPPITIAHDGMGPCEACDQDVVAGQEVHVYGDGSTPEESDDDIVVHAVCPIAPVLHAKFSQPIADGDALAYPGEVKHAYRCPVHGVIEVMVPRVDVPDEVTCPLDSWSVVGFPEEYATREGAEESCRTRGIGLDEVRLETQRCADTCPRDVTKLSDGVLIAEIAHAPPRDVHAEFLHAEHARETATGGGS